LTPTNGLILLPVILAMVIGWTYSRSGLDRLNADQVGLARPADCAVEPVW